MRKKSFVDCKKRLCLKIGDNGSVLNLPQQSFYDDAYQNTQNALQTFYNLCNRVAAHGSPSLDECTKHNDCKKNRPTIFISDDAPNHFELGSAAFDDGYDKRGN